MCKCGCNTCDIKGPVLKEQKVYKAISKDLKNHIDKKVPLFESKLNKDSKEFSNLLNETSKLYSRNLMDICKEDIQLIKEQKQLQKIKKVIYEVLTKK